MRYCDADPWMHRRLQWKGFKYFTIIMVLVVAQNLLFTYLIPSIIKALSIPRISSVIFLTNSLANFILFITLYIFFYKIVPQVRSVCKGGILRREVELVDKHRVLLVFLVILTSIFTSTVRMTLYTGLPVATTTMILRKVLLMPYAAVEILGFLAGLLPVTLNNKKTAVTLHILSYPILLLSAILETNEIIKLVLANA